MSSITKIAVIESVQAIWEFDLTLDGNHVLGGSLHVIAAIQTIAIKVSGMIRSELSDMNSIPDLCIWTTYQVL
jgi:predicted alpha-1,6-mannanase (GH76 family)